LRVHVVSDVHGSAAALARAAQGADALVVLGDLLLYVDYDDPDHGILPDLFGREAAHRFSALRREHRFGDLRVMWESLMSDIPDPTADVEAAARSQYAELFAAMPQGTYLTHGNVDIPRLWPEFLRPGVQAFDGQVAEIGGRTFGFVGGWVPRTVSRGGALLRFGAECTAEEYAAKLDAVAGVDVICTHVPPAVPELRYDTVARAFEMANEALARLIRTHQPRYALFGHVHQPLQQRLRIGRTECVNVGHFRKNGEPFVLRW
jgi:Icc-related predicted phosphoesterase